MNAKVVQLLQELRSRLLRSASDHDDLRLVLEAIHSEGVKVYLVADGSESGEPNAIALLPVSGPAGGDPPAFRIDHEDLSILRSLGIDPTRTLRRRR